MLPPEVAVHKDRHRVVAIVAPSPTDARAARQRALFADVRKACEERDLVVVPVQGKAFAVLLVGKDGGEKNRWTVPVEPRTVFSLIDAMPMRRAEMKRRRSGE